MAPFDFQQYPLPPFFDPNKTDQVWRVPYQPRSTQAREWASEHKIPPSVQDEYKISLLCVDMQNTFCTPGFELYVGGRSGRGAVEDTRRLTEFIYCNLGSLTEISATMDTHHAMQVFHPIFLVDQDGSHPDPMTLVTAEDVEQGRWRFNPAIAPSLGINPDYGQAQLEHYTRQLKQNEKYDLTIWPYHAMLGGIGHALVSSFEEALFFHTIARESQARIIAKGDNPLTESYSAVGPEVLEDAQGRPIGRRSGEILARLEASDALLIAGQAKSHCVAWTVDDLLKDIQAADPSLARKVYLLEDCTSAVVVPGIVDYTEAADQAFERFAEAGMHRVRSTEPMSSWLVVD